MAINFVKSDDIRILRDIEQYYSTQIDEMPMNGEFVHMRIKWICGSFCTDTARGIVLIFVPVYNFLAKWVSQHNGPCSAPLGSVNFGLLGSINLLGSGSFLFHNCLVALLIDDGVVYPKDY